MKMNTYGELYNYLIFKTVPEKSDLFKRMQACGKEGFFRHGIPEKMGGRGDSFVSMCLVHEELGSYSMDSGLIISLNAHIWSSIFPLIKYGTEEQKKEYLENILSGKIISAQAITEPNFGSDIASMQTMVKQNKNEYVLNGHKKYITNVPIANLIVVYARDGDGYTAFLVKPSDIGFTQKSLNLDGYRSSEIGEIILSDCSVPRTRILGKRFHGMSILKGALELERAFIFSGILGIMKSHLKTISSHAHKRKSNNKPLIRNQAISHKIAEMNLLIETIGLWIYKCARIKDQNQQLTLASSYSKLYASEACLKFYLEAVQILGACGLEKPYKLSESVLDALSGRLLSGASEIQKNIIFALSGYGDNFLSMD